MCSPCLCPPQPQGPTVGDVATTVMAYVFATVLGGVGLFMLISAAAAMAG